MEGFPDFQLNWVVKIKQPHQPGAVCQNAPHHTRKWELNWRCQDKPAESWLPPRQCRVGNKKGIICWRCQPQHNREFEEQQSQNHRGNYHPSLGCSFRNPRKWDIPIDLPVKQKDSGLRSQLRADANNLYQREEQTAAIAFKISWLLLQVQIRVKSLKDNKDGTVQ